MPRVACSEALTCRRRAQVDEASSLLLAADSEPDRALALHRRAFLELLPAAWAVLERRRCADTLLHGKCAAHEVKWSHQFLTAARACAPSKTALYAHFVGYDAYLRVAWIALNWLPMGHEPSAVAPPTVAEMPQIFSCAVSALELMSAPRPDKTVGFNYEAVLLDQVRKALNLGNASTSHEHRDALAAALDRLAGSGVLQERGMDAALQDTVLWSLQLQAKANAEKEAPGLRSCAHCGACEVHVAQFKRCSACKTVVFCSKDCQLANWPQHKAACKAARKTAAADDA